MIDGNVSIHHDVLGGFASLARMIIFAALFQVGSYLDGLNGKSSVFPVGDLRVKLRSKLKERNRPTSAQLSFFAAAAKSLDSSGRKVYLGPRNCHHEPEFFLCEGIGEPVGGLSVLFMTHMEECGATDVPS